MKTILFPSGSSFARENVITNVSFCNGKKKTNIKNKYKKQTNINFHTLKIASLGLRETVTVHLALKKTTFIIMF